MAELLRSMIARLREYIGNRRDAPRYATPLDKSLVLSITLLELQPRAVAGRSATDITGNTRDVSETGLAIIVPSIRIGGHYLTHENRTLLIALKLPNGAVQIQCKPVRYSPLEESDKNSGYLIGVRITKMSETDRALYMAYLDTLAKE